MKKTGLTVKKLLKELPEDDVINVTYYAYGIRVADALSDGMNTVGEILERTRHDCLNAWVVGIRHGETRPIILAEIVHD